MSRYQSDRQPKQYTKEKVEPRYVVKTEAPKYRIETRQTNAEQLAEETERKIESRLKPLIEGIERKLSEENSAQVESEPQDIQTEKQPTRLDELRRHVLELREFEDRDGEGSREEAEFLLNLRDALVRSVEKREQEIIEPRIENSKTESELLNPEAIHGTELSTEFKLSQQAELPFDEMDFFALESELFGIESEMEAEREDQAEVGFE